MMDFARTLNLILLRVTEIRSKGQVDRIRLASSGVTAQQVDRKGQPYYI